MIDALAQSLAALVDIPKENAYLLLGLFVGFLLGRYLKFGKQAPAGESRSSAGGAAGQSITVQAVNAKGRGESVTLDPAVLQQVQGLLQAGNNVEAIKQVREACGLDLRSSKAIVDALENMMH